MRKLLITMMACASPVVAVDRNNNSACDVWEQIYNASEIVSSEELRNSDADSDGFTNIEEALSGTDPFDASSRFRVHLGQTEQGKMKLEIDAERGKAYQVMSSSDLDEWTAEGEPMEALNDAVEFIENLETDKKFYKVLPTDIDSDNDSISDWAEEKMPGFNPKRGNSFNLTDENGNELENIDLSVLLQQLETISQQKVHFAVTSGDTDAYEKESKSVFLTVQRDPSYSSYQGTYFLNLKANPDLTKGSAVWDDFELYAEGQKLNKSFTIPAGVSEYQIEVRPLNDSAAEVPELLSLSINGTNSQSTTTIKDAESTDENKRLFIAYLEPHGDIQTAASGISILHLSGDNSFASIDLDYSNLTSAQGDAYINSAKPLQLRILENLGSGILTDKRWDILASEAANINRPTDQSVLDTLLNGNLIISKSSTGYTSAEITGYYREFTGSSEEPTAPSTPPIAQLEGHDLDREIARFLTQATYGPTPESIADMRARIDSHGGNRMDAFEEWIEEQFSMGTVDLLPISYALFSQYTYLRTLDGGSSGRGSFLKYHTNDWGLWTMASQAKDQLRQRAAFALHQIFVTSGFNVKYLGHASYFDMIKNSSFGSYRDLLEGVSTHPIMANWLSFIRNQKATYDTEGNLIVFPDENFAREIMQLFSIGLLKLHPDGTLVLDSNGDPTPTYDQDDIREVARVFTGWALGVGYAKIENTNFSFQGTNAFLVEPNAQRLKNFENHHDFGSKSMPNLGLSIPKNLPAEEELDIFLDHLATHDSTAPFICAQLIQRMVTSNPSRDYVYRVTNAWNASGGNLGVVFKAILLDPEARDLDLANHATFGKKKEPIIHSIATIRAHNSTTGVPFAHLDPEDTSVTNLLDYTNSTERLMQMADNIRNMGEDAYQLKMPRHTLTSQQYLLAPSVFNYYLPDYTISGEVMNAGLKVPEFQILDSQSIVQESNFMHNLLISDNGVVTKPVPYESTTDYNPYNISSSRLMPDSSISSARLQAYISVMDENGDGIINASDVNTYKNSAKIAEACASLVDHLDLMLCAGRMKALQADGFVVGITRDGYTRDVLLNTLIEGFSEYDSSSDTNLHNDVILERANLASYLISISSEATIQQ